MCHVPEALQRSMHISSKISERTVVTAKVSRSPIRLFLILSMLSAGYLPKRAVHLKRLYCSKRIGSNKGVSISVWLGTRYSHDPSPG
jgi:hypothetical protein